MSNNKLIDVKELAELLGVHPSTIKNYRKRGLPCYKVARSVRYDLEEVKRWMKGNL